APPNRATAAMEAMLGGCGIRREAAAAIIIQTRTVMRGLDIRFSLPQSVFRLAAAGALYHSGSRSQNQNESLNTRSPIANFTDSLKLGPSKTNEWNSPFSPHGSTCAGSAARKFSSISLPTND